jgi:arginase family enzyme
LEWIISQKLEVIHVSLDIDGIDPDYIKSTGTIAANGINISDVC